MTAIEFAEATWWAPLIMALFFTGERTWRWSFGLVGLWIVAVLVLAVARG